MPEIEIIALEQGIFSVGPLKKFIPITEDEAETSASPKTPTVRIRPFLIRIDGCTILLDTGLHQDQPFIVAELEKHAVNVADVDIILLSHLHKDHTGGIGTFIDGQFKPHFPQAKIYIQEQEMDFARSQKDNPSYLQDQLAAIAKLPNTILSTDLKGKLTTSVRFETVGGHSPYHRAFWIEHNGETVFYGGDNLPTRGYLKYPVAYKNDYDGRLALELRKDWESQATAQHWKILLYHDKKIPVLEF